MNDSEKGRMMSSVTNDFGVRVFLISSYVFFMVNRRLLVEVARLLDKY
jgi:hypothetical protein